MGNSNHRRYVAQLLDLVAAGLVDPAAFITQEKAHVGDSCLRNILPPGGGLDQDRP
jgi:hypothetical protein